MSYSTYAADLGWIKHRLSSKYRYPYAVKRLFGMFYDYWRLDVL